MKNKEEMAAQMQSDLTSSLEGHLKEMKVKAFSGELTRDFRSYSAFFRDGTSREITPSEMRDLVMSDDVHGLVMSLHVWMYQEGEQFYACGEIASVRGIELNLVAKVTPAFDEFQGWITPDEVGGAVKEYFDERNSAFDAAMARTGVTHGSSEYGAN